MYIDNRDQCITYFNWLQLRVVVKKHDVKKGYISYCYQKHFDRLEDQCEKKPYTLMPTFKFITI